MSTWRKVVCCLATVAVAGVSDTAVAADVNFTWNAAVLNGSWKDGANWDRGTYPNALKTDYATFSKGTTTIPLAVVGSLSNPSPSGQADARDFSLRAHSLRTSIVAPKSFSADLSGRVRLRSGIVPPNAPTQRFALSALGILDTDRGVSPCGPH